MNRAKVSGRFGRAVERSAALLKSRNWSVSFVLTVMLAMPFGVALATDALVVRASVATHLVNQQGERIARTAHAAAAALAAVQRERDQSAAVAGRTDGNVDLTTARAETNTAVAHLETVTASMDSVRDAMSVARKGLARLNDARDKVISVEVVREYSMITNALLDLEGALLPLAGDTQVSGQLTGAYGLSRAHEYAVQHELLTEIGLSQGGALGDSARSQARSSMGLAQNWLDVFSLTAPHDASGPFSFTLPKTDIDAWRALSVKVFGPDGAFNPAVTGQEWRAASQPVISKLGDAVSRILDAAEVTARSNSSASGKELRDLTIGLALATLLAGLAAILILRRVVRSLRLLRVATVDVAHRWLPGILLKIRDGQAADEDLRMPARVLPSREFGAIVTAFEAACDQAVLAATEQTRVRSGYAEVFIDQFRRTQSLMQRQLYLIEQLELSEKSPELLSKLFQLDHLVTRMRRNNENMLVVSGTELARKPTEAASIESIIRSAMSEIEHYQRVELIDPPAGKIVASAGNDLVRMLAELIDNAASFSPPETAVTVRAYVRRDGSLSIAVVDNGVGMTDIKVREVNERLTRLGSNELARSRRVGLLVVGRLAGRHGIGVELLGGDTHTGVTALISVPSEFVIEAERPGWADRRHAMQAAARREAVLEATGVTRGAVQNSDGRNAPRTADMRPAKSIGNPVAPSLGTGSVLGRSLNNTASMDGVPRTAVSSSKIRSIRDAIDGRTWDLLERAHADVAEELPTRTPNPLIGRPAPGKDAAERVASAWFRARNTAGQRRSTSTAAGVDDATPDDWNDGWIVLDAPPRPETYEYTEDGLPVRERGAHLVPGSAKPKAGDATQTPRQPIPRDPAHTRSRLSSFQQGVRRAKAKATQTGKPRSTAERAR